MENMLSTAATVSLARPLIAEKAQPPAFTRVVTLNAAEATSAAGAVRLATVSQPQAASVTPNIANLRYIDPNFARQIIALRPIPTGVPRTEITMPVAPNADVTDTMLFEDAKDPSKKYYLPAYQVGMDTTGGGPVGNRYRISLAPDGPGWALRVFLQKVAPTAIGDAARTAQELDHQISVMLRHSQLMGGAAAAQEELLFTEVTAPPGGLVQAVLRVATVPERDQLYRVLTDTTYNAAFIVRRAITVAIPVPPASPGKPSPTGLRAVDRVAVDRAELPSHLPALPGGPSPTVPPRPAMFMSRPMARSVALNVEMMRTDIAIGDVVTQPVLPSPPPPLFRQVARALDMQVEPQPFAFIPALHGYIFGGIAPDAGGGSDLIRREVTWTDGRTYSYYQDPVRRHVFSFLPDTFKMARRPDAQHEPLASVRFDSADGSPANIKATFAYIAVPYTDPARLHAAIASLKQFVDTPLPPNVSGPQFEPLLPPPDTTHLKLAYPGAQSSGGPYEPRPQAMVDLRSGISDSLSMTVTQFAGGFASLCGGGGAQLSGAVAFDMGGVGEQIPFTLDFSDTAGDLFQQTQSSPANGRIAVSLRNAIESPIQITSLSATILNGQDAIPAQLQGLDLSAPVKIAPGDAVSVTAVAPDGTELSAGAVVHLAMSGAATQPDETAILEAILDASTPATYTKDITVKTFAAIFDPPANPADKLQEIVVDFENGPTAELTPTQLERSVKLTQPLANYILQKGDLSHYRYKLTFVKLTGQTHDADWRPGDSGLLIVTAG